MIGRIEGERRCVLREVIDDPSFAPTGNHPVRLFIGSGMPAGLWKRVVEVFAPAHVVEFFATTDGQAVLANVSGAKIGSKGRPLPGGGDVELAAYDAEDDLILEDERGFVRRAEVNEVGVMLAHPRGPIDPTASVKRGVFSPADTWVSTEYLFRRDQDGDYWLVDSRSLVIRSERGPVYAAPVNDAVGGIDAVDMSVTYAVQSGGQRIAVSAGELDEIFHRAGVAEMPERKRRGLTELRAFVAKKIVNQRAVGRDAFVGDARDSEQQRFGAHRVAALQDARDLVAHLRVIGAQE
jgi:acyl-CoA synthetase (AMP-forming)/AMP-acid ligase II